MSKQIRFSRLAIAAGILLAASATSFAQTEPTESRNEPAPAIIAMNAKPKFEMPAAKHSTATVADTKKTTNPFSASRFVESAKQSLINNNLKITTTTLETKTTADQFSEPAKTKSITFVPSRGPRLPQ